jgi:hypothetical protein
MPRPACSQVGSFLEMQRHDQKRPTGTGQTGLSSFTADEGAPLSRLDGPGRPHPPRLGPSLGLVASFGTRRSPDHLANASTIQDLIPKRCLVDEADTSIDRGQRSATCPNRWQALSGVSNSVQRPAVGRRSIKLRLAFSSTEQLSFTCGLGENSPAQRQLGAREDVNVR